MRRLEGTAINGQGTSVQVTTSISPKPICTKVSSGRGVARSLLVQQFVREAPEALICRAAHDWRVADRAAHISRPNRFLNETAHAKYTDGSPEHTFVDPFCARASGGHCTRNAFA